jgi:predicted ester cyclase
MSDTDRSAIHAGLARAARAGESTLGSALTDICHSYVRMHCCHPLGDFAGVSSIDAGLWRPLRKSFPDLERRDDIFLAGRFRGGGWIIATGHYFGTFVDDWLGIPAHGKWAYLRYGEAYRMEAGRIAQGYVLLDLVGLMRQAGCAPWRAGAGVETLSPGPGCRDGVRLAGSETVETAATLDLVMAMLGQLFQPDRASMGMERFWSPDMMWYGPAMIGTTRGLDGFFRDHQVPWMTAFPDWQDALEAPHFADGPYACYSGWPSIRATHTGPLFGLAPTGRTVDIRVMDWWRRDGALLAENWIFVDFPHLFLQLGIDLFQLMREHAARPGPAARDQ